MPDPSDFIGVVKIGGARGNAPGPLLRELSQRVSAGEKWLLVHGASGPMEILCEAAEMEPNYVVSPSGFKSRYVSRDSLTLFEYACAAFTVELISCLAGVGVPSKPMYPKYHITAKASRKDVLRVVEGGKRRILRGNYSGTITSFDPCPVREAWNQGFLPLLPPLALDEEGQGNLNVDGDRLAASAAAALGARYLVILTNVPGLMKDISDPGSLISRGFLENWEDLESFAKGNMKRKLVAAKEALEGGTGQVILTDSRAKAPLEKGLNGGGTWLCRKFTVTGE